MDSLAAPTHEIAESLSETILLSLQCETPEPAALCETIQRSWHLPPLAAQTLLYRIVAQLNARLFPPLTRLEIVHTEGCNLGCRYCFEKEMLGVRKIAPSVALAAVDLLFDYARDERRVFITHFGGEPTLNMPGVRLATEYAEQKARATGKVVEFHMTSNGVLFAPPMVDYFGLHQIHVLLSIDGLEASHDRYRRDRRGRGTFRRVVAALALLKTVQPWVGVKMTVMPENVPSLLDDVKGLYDLSVNQFIVGYSTGFPWSQADREAYGRALGDVYRWYTEKPRRDLKIAEFDAPYKPSGVGCHAGRTSVAVAVTGEILPCAKILALNNKALLGKLGDTTFGLTHFRNRLELVTCTQVQEAWAALGREDEYNGGCFASNYDENHHLFQPSLQEHAFAVQKRCLCGAGGACTS